MKVLWLSNALFPEACKELNIKPPAVGGWMHSGAMALLSANTGVKLGVIALYRGTELKVIDKYAIEYYLVPSVKGSTRYSAETEKHFRNINRLFEPDLVHIHGTEYPHALAWVKACGNHNVVVSIQGLVSVYATYFMGGIPIEEIRKKRTFRDIVRHDSLISQQREMQKRGLFEIELLESVSHVIGRTTWDQSHVWSINPDAKYHFCNETLRAGFYEKNWDYEKCRKHTIFLSQAHYPIKGIQQVIKALPIVLRHYPDTEVFVAGYNFINVPRYRRNGFANYLLGLMKELNVLGKFHFMGMLDEEKMVEEYLKANVFVCPSAIENSPNSVGEAQLLGTPVVASYVGGSMDMVSNGESGLMYRFEETSLLAMLICKIFEDTDLAKALSVNGRITAKARHDKAGNGNVLNKIYLTIMGNKNTQEL